ncbi:MAG: S49 family peptidase [Tagaea sp.]|nr:S49 family peptidase [Azospirillum sp.]MCZ8123252.1 S49 family peptidase [Magnetospirillum sp.]
MLDAVRPAFDKLLGREPAPVVGVMRLQGPIGVGGRRGLSMERLAGPLERMFKTKGLAAIALVINSPGGAPAQSALIGARIRALADQEKRPVYAYVEDVAASGGYWIAAAADEIVADANSIVGSIGVISAGFGFPDLLRRLGVERRLHTAGARKSLLDPFGPEKPEDVERLRALQGELHANFKNWVRTRRGAKLKGEDATLFEGEFWTGAKALELGLIDALGDARADLRRRFGEKVRYRGFATAGGGFLRRVLGMSAGERDLAGDALDALEVRAAYARFGL